MQADSDIPDPSASEAASASAPAAAPRPIRRMAWLGAATLAFAAAGAAIWGVRAFQTDQAIANVERSVAGIALPAAPTPGPAPAPLPSAPSPVTAASVDAAPVASGDRLPPLALPGRRVPDAVLRDLPDWVAAQVTPPRTSGGSADESAAPPQRGADARTGAERPAPVQRERPSAVFARCPGPGESGAVECRRAVCAGAARKSSSCAPYLSE